MPAIDIAANTRAAQSQVKDLSKALDDTADSLDDLARDGDKAGDKMESSFRAMVLASGRTQKAVSDDAKKGGRDLERGYRDGAKDAAKGVDDGLDAIKRSTEEAGDELRQNLGETFSSFRGDLEDLPQIAQDVFGGMAGGASNLAGSLALAGGAAGIGLLVAGLQLADEERQKLEERANGLAQAYIDAGSTVLDAMTIASRTTEILTGDERAKAEEYANTLGITIPEAARAMAGDLNQLAVVNAIAAKGMDENRQIADDMRESLKALTPEQQRSVEQNSKQNLAARELAAVVDGANTKFEEQQEVLKGLVRDAGEVTQEVDELGNKLLTLPDNTQIMIDAETGKATADVSKFKGDLDGVPETVRSTVVVGVDDSAWRNWRPGDKVGEVRTAVRPGSGGGTTWF
ncbi:hypothetical protein [Microbacterium sp. RG1]|uniref:hypothetical protein n=1 Tax=Microbacterium sp. RG1 TaxID=2489212 RepID=UPI0010CA39B3|nr:hypothetical protein [Microbacterium sp. RG1]QCQ16986.1 hypothetical protein EHF32_09790 [Microbacterium sp. RG1]